MKTQIIKLLNLIRIFDRDLLTLTAMREAACQDFALQWKIMHEAAGYGQATPAEQKRWDKMVEGCDPAALAELLDLLIRLRRSIVDFMAAFERTRSIQAAALELIRTSPPSFNPSRN